MGDLSRHFSRSEFRCRGFGQPGHPEHDTPVSGHLIDHLENLRTLAGGKPLRIVSGHRCAWWNGRVGGAKRSQHMNGTAADIPIGYATTKDAATAGFTGIGSKGTWAVHVDVRTRPARWAY